MGGGDAGCEFECGAVQSSRHVAHGFGGLWFALWQTRLRLAELVFILFGVLLPLIQSRPIAIVSTEGKIALRGSDG